VGVVPTPVADPNVGTLVGGRYALEQLLGVGGFGRVYQAIQVPLGRRVAVKLLSARQPELSARFAREASLAQRLEHPNTVRILDYGATPEGTPFIVFELLRGRTVADLLRDEGPLPVPVALTITAQVLKSLMEAHALGIIHRDIKPANVFVTPHPGEPYFVRVLDFGIAKDILAPAGPLPRAGTLPIHDPASSPTLTRGSEMMGTPRYMAPEQAMSDAAGPETDIYAVGLLLAEMLLGRPVYDGNNALQIALEQASTNPVPLGGLTASPVGPILVRATQKARALRYPTASVMLGDVESFLTGATWPAAGVRVADQRIAASGAIAPTMITPTKAVRPERRGLAAALAIGAVLLLAGSVSALAIVRPWERPAARETEEEDEEKPPKGKRGKRDPFELPEPPDVDFSKRRAPESARGIEAALKKQGFEIHSTDTASSPGFQQWTWTVSAPPCGGSVLLMIYDSVETARMSAEILAKNRIGRVFQTDGRVFYVAVLRATHAKGDPACTDPLADALTR
jgi:hypothetical protein